MTRYFYTDPLAAAWMAKHFGMHFQHGDLTYGYHTVIERMLTGNNINHIHPDSLQLLEPRRGDIVFYRYGYGGHAGEAWDEVRGVIRHNDEGYPYTGNGEAYVLLDGGASFGISRLRRIIQRNGLAFHYPESEAA